MKAGHFRLWLLLAALMAIVYSGGSALATDDSTPLEAQIGKLESRLFEHQYEGDSTKIRLARLEKMVFGESKDGSDSERLSSLEAALADSEPIEQSLQDDSRADRTNETPDQAPFVNQPPAASAAESAADERSQAPVDSASGARAASDDNRSDSGDYPRITALENQILGTTYQDLPVTRRLEQLETKAFGKPSTQVDLSARTDKLEKYVRNHLHLRTYGEQIQTEQDYQSEAAPPTAMPPVRAAATEPPLDSPITAKLDWMELVVFGRPDQQDGAVVRVDRLEKALFPEEDNSSQASLEDQISMLMGAVELMQNGGQTAAAPGSVYQLGPGVNSGQFAAGAYPLEPPGSAYGQQQYIQSNQEPVQQPAQSSKKNHPLLKSIAHVLGEVGGMALGAVSNSGLMYGSPYGYGYGYGGFGMPGMWW